MKSYIFLVLFLVSNIFCQEEIPDYVSKGLRAMENPSIPYSDFLKAQEYYKEKFNKTITFEHMEEYERPDSFYYDGIYSSKRLKYYTYFAEFAYCDAGVIEAGKCCIKLFNKDKDTTSPNGWTLIDYGTSSGVDTHNIYTHEKNMYSVFKSDLFRKVVIAFPGTENPDQFVQLASQLIYSGLDKPELKTFSGDIEINKYVNARASALIEKIFSKTNIKKMKLDEGYQVIFTGHSLGGSMACASLFFAVDRGFITRAKNKPVLITYGQPRTGNGAFASAVNHNAEVIYRLVNTMDIVTQVPLYGQDYRHTVGEITIDGDNKNINIVEKLEAYNVDKIVDEQKYDLILLVKYLINNMDRHGYYFGQHSSTYCDS